MKKKYYTCSVVCDNKMTMSTEFKYKVLEWFDEFIKKENVREFLFSYNLGFDMEHLAYCCVDYYRDKYPDIRRVHIRDHIFLDIERELCENKNYEYSKLFKELVNYKGNVKEKKIKIKIEQSDICIFYKGEKGRLIDLVQEGIKYAKKLKKRTIIITNDEIKEVTQN